MHAGKWGVELDWCTGCIPAERAHQAWVLPVVSAPFHATTPSEGGAGYCGTWYPPLCWLEGRYWVWAVWAAAWYFLHTQADPLLAASAAWLRIRRLSRLPAPNLEKKRGRLLLG